MRMLTIVAALALASCCGYGGLPYGEPADPAPFDRAAWDKLDLDLGAGYGSVDVRYARSAPPATLEAQWEATAWRGERVHTQIVVWSRKPVARLRAKVVEGTLPVSIGLLRYVLTDGLNGEGGGCGLQPMAMRDSSLVADAIEPLDRCGMEPFTARPFWVSVDVPRDTPPGVYNGTVEVAADGRRFELPFVVNVVARTLPPASEWKFHLDLWQNPYSVARFHDVEAWSDEHFALMRPLMERLTAAGQKCITVSMIHDPWNGQTYDVYGSMIRWVRRGDGTWSYDYTVFDRWVEFMTSLGVTGAVNCYSMAPWDGRFRYYDEATGRDTALVAKTGSPEYVAHWRPMLTDFARHLRDKGWFGRTAIAMDERPEAEMKAVAELVRSVDAEFRVSLAGSYHPAMSLDLYDYCISLGEQWPAEVLKYRRARGLPTTFYTCCVEGHPNTFTFSPTAEAAWMGWHAAAMGYDGYLRWAWNCWPGDALHDSRFGTWSGGDTYLVYPGNRSSVRFERLVEGIQAFEKVRILSETIAPDDMARLEAALEGFRDKTPAVVAATAAEKIRAAQKTINGL